MHMSLKRTLSVIILVVLFIPFIDGIFHITEKCVKFKNNEMRALSQKPEADFSYLDPYPKLYEQYYNDHFMCRNFFIDRYNRMRVKFFNQSPVPEKAFIGKYRWLYLHNYNHHPSHKVYFSDKQLKQILKELKRRQDFLKAQNCSLYVYIVPTKIKVYPEYAGSLAPYEPNQGLQLETYLRKNSDLKVTYLLPTLVNAKHPSAPFLFLTTDNHWSDYGAYLASTKIINDLKADFPNLNPVPFNRLRKEEALTRGGNIAGMMGMEDYFQERRHLLKVNEPTVTEDTHKKYQLPPDFDGAYELQYDNKDTTLPHALFIRDSFGGPMVPFLSESFGHSTFIFDKWMYLQNREIVKNEKPQIMVYIIYEPLLFNLLGS